MKVSVKPLRQHVARLSGQQIASLPAVDGYLSFYGIITTLRLSIYDSNALFSGAGVAERAVVTTVGYAGRVAMP